MLRWLFRRLWSLGDARADVVEPGIGIRYIRRYDITSEKLPTRFWVPVDGSADLSSQAQGETAAPPTTAPLPHREWIF